MNAHAPFATCEDFTSNFQEKVGDAGGFQMLREVIQSPAFRDSANIDVQPGESFAQGRGIVA